MSRIYDSDEDDGNRPSALLQTTRFAKSGTIGTKDFRTTPLKSKQTEVSNLKIDLHRMNEDDEDSLNDSEDESNTKTGRSTSSATTSQLTPKPKERSFLRTNTDKQPKVQQRRIDIDDDDRNVFGHTTMKPSPRHEIHSLREEEERNQSFMNDFRREPKRKSPTDLFSLDRKSDSRRNSRKSFDDSDKKSAASSDDDDDDSLPKHKTSSSSFLKSQKASTHEEKPASRRTSHKIKDESDQSDHDESFKKRQSIHDGLHHQDWTKPRRSNHEIEQVNRRDIEANTHEHQPTSSRPSSASRKEPESVRRSSYCEDEETVIQPATQQKSQSRPTSAKSNTSRRQTQSAIDNVISANAPTSHDPLTSNNEALAATLQSSASPPLPRPSATLPPKPKSDLHTTRTTTTTTTTGGINKKPKYKVPSRYQEVTSRINTGRTPLTEEELRSSVSQALKKALKSPTLPRPQSARVRKHSANNTTNTNQQRRRSSSAYEHVQPRVNTNRSINFNELDTSQMRANSSQSIKDAVYLEWVKTKEEQKKQDKEQLKRWKEESAKSIDKANLERKIRQEAQNLERWRQEKDEQLRKKQEEERALRRELIENKKNEEQKKKKDAKDGFEDWVAKKSEDIAKSKAEEERRKKAELEKQQEEKRKKFLESEERVKKWEEKKKKQDKKKQEAMNTTREEQLKKIREQEENKFVSAQEAYEKWLKEKEQYETEDKIKTQRRNSLSTKQQQVPFLPGGSQKNTGKVRHVVW